MILLLWYSTSHMLCPGESTSIGSPSGAAGNTAHCHVMATLQQASRHLTQGMPAKQTVDGVRAAVAQVMEQSVALVGVRRVGANGASCLRMALAVWPRG